ncbi:MAG: ribonuclease T [Sphingomonas sp.]|nr:ribonuclease T [Sphingomonas sp.]
MASRPLGWSATVLIAGLVAVPAHAQMTACTLPSVLPVPRVETVQPSQRRTVAIGSYTLALSWSPEHCSRARASDGFQCDGEANRFGFILHGLWPDGQGRDWPQYCRPAQRLSPALIRRNLCATPSAGLLQHQWTKHGVCMSRTPERYFDLARGLYAKLRFPEMAALATDPDLTAARFTDALLAANRSANPALRREAISLAVTRDGWLDEVRLCLDQRLRFAPCRANQARGANGERALRIRRPG